MGPDQLSPAEEESRPAGATAAQTPQTAVAQAHHQRGLRLVKEGQLVEAEQQFRQALRLRPDLADAHGNLGVVCARLGRLPEAEAAFRLAIRLNPTAVAMYTNLGLACLEQGKASEAELWLRQGLQLRPEAADAHRLLGVALEARHQPAPAEAAYREALRLQPDLADAHFRLAALLNRRGQAPEAEAAFRAAVRLQPTHTGAWNGLGILLEARGRPGEAEACYRQALQHQPDAADVLNNLGIALAAQDRLTEAEAVYRQALRLKPDSANTLNNLGNTLRLQDRLEEAAQSLEQALRLQAHYPEAHCNLGIVHVHQGRIAEGLAHYDEALRLRPDYPEAHLNRALAWLGNGDLARGWPEYEWRWQGRQLQAPQFAAPRWDGSPLQGRTILLCAEQGLGDSIQFIRYAALLHQAGATVLLDCPAALAGVLATCPGVSRVIPRGQPLPPFDVHAPLLSLPGLLGTTLDTIPAPVPYLRADPERVAFWRQQLEGLPGLRVGIAWQGSKQHKGDRQRSVRLAQFAAVAALPEVTLCSLQQGEGREQLTEGAGAQLPVRDLDELTQPGFADTAALLLNLDLVLTVDTAVAHLAGALGRPVWLALPFAADWRWLRGRDDTPWYPTMRLFRQAARGAWDAVFQRLAAAVRDQGPALRAAARVGERPADHG